MSGESKKSPFATAGVEHHAGGGGSCNHWDELGQFGVPNPSVATRTTSVMHSPQKSQGSYNDQMHSCSHKGCETQEQGPTPLSLMPI